MAKGKMRIGYAIMTKKGNLVLGPDGQYGIYRRKTDASGQRMSGETVVRVTIDEDA